jgi:hypothetical protein
MSKYEEGMAILEEKFGGNKDNVIALATIAVEPNTDGKPRPVVRDVDAYYEDGVFYSVVWGETSKIAQITNNNEVAVAPCYGWFSANGIGENLGWVLEEKNAEIRAKLRKAFEWYDDVNNENDKNCIFLAVRLTSGTIIINHHEKVYYMDFVNKTATMGGHGV